MDGGVLFEVALGAVDLLVLLDRLPGQVLKDPVCSAVATVVGEHVITATILLEAFVASPRPAVSSHLITLGQRYLCERMLSSPGKPKRMICATRVELDPGSGGKSRSLAGTGT